MFDVVFIVVASDQMHHDLARSCSLLQESCSLLQESHYCTAGFAVASLFSPIRAEEEKLGTVIGIDLGKRGHGNVVVYHPRTSVSWKLQYWIAT